MNIKNILGNADKGRRKHPLEKLKGIKYDECREALQRLQEEVLHTHFWFSENGPVISLKEASSNASPEALKALAEVASNLGSLLGSDIAEKAFKDAKLGAIGKESYLQDLAKNLLLAMDDYERECLERIPVGFLPFPGVATTLCVNDNGRYFIIVNSGIWEFKHGANKLISSRLEVPGQVLPRVDWEDYLSLISAWANCALEAKPGPFLPAQYLDPRVLFFAGLLDHGQDFFILGHEYGHLIGGHFEPINPQELMRLDPKMYKNVSKVLNDDVTKIREVEADLIGASLALLAIERFSINSAHVSIMQAGIDAFFSYQHLLERIESCNPDHRDLVQSQILHSHYPPAFTRRDFWREKFAARLSQDAREVASGISQLVDQTIEDLLSEKYGTIDELAQNARDLGFSSAWVDKGKELFDSVRDKEALACFDRALETNPKISEAWSNVIEALQRLGRTEVLEYSDRAIEIASHDSIAWYNTGNALLRLERIEEALACYKMALEIDPQLSHAWLNTGTTLATLGYHRDAIVCFKRVADLTPKSLEDKSLRQSALDNLGNVYNQLGDPRQAIVCYEQAFALAQDIGDRVGEGKIQGKLGKLQYDLGNIRLAIGLFEQSLVIMREVGERHEEGIILGHLGAAYNSFGNVRRAFEYSNQSFAIAQEVEDVRQAAFASLNLAFMFFEQGQRSEAIVKAELAVQFFKQFGNAQDVQKAQELISRIREKVED